MQSLSIIPNIQELPQAELALFIASGGRFCDVAALWRSPHDTADGNGVVYVKLTRPDGTVIFARIMQSLFMGAASAFKGAHLREDGSPLAKERPPENAVHDPRLEEALDVINGAVSDFRKLYNATGNPIFASTANIYETAMEHILAKKNTAEPTPEQRVGNNQCSEVRRAHGLPYPRTCVLCKLGPCINKNPDAKA